MGTTEYGSVYEGNYGGTAGDCFRPIFIDRTAFGRAQSGWHKLTVDQQPGKNFRSRTPFRLQTVGYISIDSASKDHLSKLMVKNEVVRLTELVTRGLEAAVLARSIQGVRAVKEDILI